jgi:hypothetical protein
VRRVSKPTQFRIRAIRATTECFRNQSSEWALP